MACERMGLGGTGKLVCPWGLGRVRPIETAPSNKLATSHILEIRPVHATQTGGSVQAEGIGDGGWANHRQAALDDATQNSRIWESLAVLPGVWEAPR